MITKVKMVNCQSWKNSDFTLVPDRLNTIVADNGTGKSVFMKMLKITACPKYFSREERKHLIRTGEESATIYFEFDDGGMACTKVFPTYTLYMYKPFDSVEIQKSYEPLPEVLKRIGLITDESSDFVANIIDTDQDLLLVNSKLKNNYNLIRMHTQNPMLETVRERVCDTLIKTLNTYSSIASKKQSLQSIVDEAVYFDIDTRAIQLDNTERSIDLMYQVIDVYGAVAKIVQLFGFVTDYELLSKMLTVLETIETIDLRKFEVFEQPGTKSIAKDSVIGQISSDQKIKTYGTRYVVAATGAVYQRVDTICGTTDPLFACVYKYAKGEISEIASLTVRSREAYSVLLNTGQSLLRNGTAYRYAGKRTINQLQYYGIMPAKLLATDGNVVSKCYELKLTKSSGNTFAAKVWLQGTNKRLCSLNSTDFANSYSSNLIATIGGISESSSKSVLSSTLYNTGVFFNPSSLNSNPELLKSILGKDELYLFTDKGNTEGALDGKLYQWTGDRLLEVTKTSDLATIASDNVPIYAIPVYYAPCDTFFVQRDNAGSIILESNFINKALHHIQYDLTSINNQLIEAYLSEQQGVVKINTLADGAVVMLGDTVWTKVGDYWQSSPIHDSTNIKAIISGDQDLMWYSNSLFSGLYLNVQGKQYSLQGYVNEMKLGSLVGSEKQYKKGIVYLDGNEIKVRKKDKIRVASAKTSAEYVSVMCKFNDELLVRPINAESTQYTYLAYCSTGIVPYANYPFFDAEASWDSQRMVLYPVNVSRYKPSPAFHDTKETLNSQFKQLFIEDSWNYIWVLIIILASYLLVMSWVAYGIVTMGVGRAGFEALTLRNRNGNGKGIDFIKLATFGVYSLDREIPLTRLIVISFGCCFIIVTVLLVIF